MERRQIDAQPGLLSLPRTIPFFSCRGTSDQITCRGPLVRKVWTRGETKDGGHPVQLLQTFGIRGDHTARANSTRRTSRNLVITGENVNPPSVYGPSVGCHRLLGQVHSARRTTQGGSMGSWRVRSPGELVGNAQPESTPPLQGQPGRDAKIGNRGRTQFSGHQGSLKNTICNVLCWKQ